MWLSGKFFEAGKIAYNMQAIDALLLESQRHPEDIMAVAKGEKC